MKAHALFLVALMGQAACINQNQSGAITPRNVDTSTVGATTKITWALTSSTNNDKQKISSVGLYPYQFCLMNTDASSCSRPPATGSEIRNTLGEAPAMIQSFQPAIKTEKVKSVTITSATVTTALLTINTATGKPSFSRQHTRQIYGTAKCDTTNANAVGIPIPNQGEESILTGLYLFDTGTYNNGKISGALLTSGRALVSGIKPSVGTSSAPYQYEFVPDAAAEIVDFGLDAFSTTNPVLKAGTNTIASQTTMLLQPFGLDQSYVDDQEDAAELHDASAPKIWQEMVVVAFCIQGTKVLTISDTQTATMPLFLRSETIQQRPTMSLK